MAKGGAGDVTYTHRRDGLVKVHVYANAVVVVDVAIIRRIRRIRLESRIAGCDSTESPPPRSRKSKTIARGHGARVGEERSAIPPRRMRRRCRRR